MSAGARASPGAARRASKAAESSQSPLPGVEPADDPVQALAAQTTREVAIKNVAANARIVWSKGQFDSEAVPSPCISLCRVDPHTGWCDGCLRTLDEISEWSRLDEAGKRRVWQAIGRRAEGPAAESAGGLR